MHLLVRWILAPLCRLLYRPVVQGADGVPRGIAALSRQEYVDRYHERPAA